MGVLVRYSDAFAVDRVRTGCWRYVYEGRGDDSGASGRPCRCPGAVMWAGWYRVRDRRWRVWACDDHVDGGEGWVHRPDPPAEGPR